EARPGRAPVQGIPHDGGRDGGDRPLARPGVPSGAHPDGHPAAGDERDRRPRAPAGRSGHSQHSGDGGHCVRDDAGSPEDPCGRLRRLPVEADRCEGVHCPGRGDARRRTPRERAMTQPAAKILVVDDTPQNVKLLADLLTVKGYAVVTAASGAEALSRIEAERPDLILLDVVMPGMSGYEVCQRIRSDGGNGTLPVVMVTALDPASERIKGLEAGADDFLTKPINLPELLARVRSLLRIKQLYDTVETQSAELAELNRTLEVRVADQVGQLERLSKL